MQPEGPVHPRESPWRRRSIGCLGVLVVGLLLMIVSEIVLRRTLKSMFGRPLVFRGMYQMQDGGLYALRPGWAGFDKVAGEGIPYRIDRHGLRGVAVGVPPKDARRVLVLGDEMVFGPKLPDRLTLPGQLQRQLRASMSDVPLLVGNGGVPEYGTRDIAAHMARQRRAESGFDPHAVVALVSMNTDVLDDCRRHSDIVGGLLFHGPMARAAASSTRMRTMLRLRSLYGMDRIVAQYLPSLAFDASALPWTSGEQSARQLFPRTDLECRHGLFLDRRIENKLVTQVMARLRKHLTALRDAAKPAPLLVVLLPSVDHLTAAGWESELRRAGRDPQEFEFGITQNRISRLADQLGVPILDLTPFMRGAKLRDQFFRGELLTAEGCAQIAGWLRPEVQTMLEH